MEYETRAQVHLSTRIPVIRPTAKASTGSRALLKTEVKKLACRDPQRHDSKSIQKEPRHQRGERMPIRKTQEKTGQLHCSPNARATVASSVACCYQPVTQPARAATLCASSASRNCLPVIHPCSIMSRPSGIRWRWASCTIGGRSSLAAKCRLAKAPGTLRRTSPSPFEYRCRASAKKMKPTGAAAGIGTASRSNRRSNPDADGRSRLLCDRRASSG